MVIPSFGGPDQLERYWYSSNAFKVIVTVTKRREVLVILLMPWK
jgi:hypothetical protein